MSYFLNIDDLKKYINQSSIILIHTGLCDYEIKELLDIKITTNLYRNIKIDSATVKSIRRNNIIEKLFNNNDKIDNNTIYLKLEVDDFSYINHAPFLPEVCKYDCKLIVINRYNRYELLFPMDLEYHSDLILQITQSEIIIKRNIYGYCTKIYY